MGEPTERIADLPVKIQHAATRVRFRLYPAISGSRPGGTRMVKVRMLYQALQDTHGLPKRLRGRAVTVPGCGTDACPLPAFPARVQTAAIRDCVMK